MASRQKNVESSNVVESRNGKGFWCVGLGYLSKISGAALSTSRRPIVFKVDMGGSRDDGEATVLGCLHGELNFEFWPYPRLQSC